MTCLGPSLILIRQTSNNGLISQAYVQINRTIWLFKLMAFVTSCLSFAIPAIK